MAYKISDDCISCGACEAECPNKAISEGESQYNIDVSKCTECVGFGGEAKCASVCPTESAKKDESKPETQEQLLAKFHKLHPGQKPA
jgi:ferredoxin